MPLAEFYKVLKLSKVTSINDLRTAYRHLALQFHPDVNKEKHAANKFRQITEAYNAILKEKLKHIVTTTKSEPFTGMIHVHNEFNVTIQNEWHLKYNRVRSINTDIKCTELNELGYNQSEHISRTIFSILTAYKSIQSSLVVPYDFIIPYQDHRFPRDSWGLRLGVVVQNIRLHEYLSESRQAFQTLGINYIYSDVEVLKALKTFKELHGHLSIHRKFIVPFDDSKWDSALGGLKLGKVVHQIRTNNAYSEYKDALLDMGFEYEGEDDSVLKSGNRMNL